ncbi:alpha-amylase family glycosyl hydrolase [Oceanobacillus jeddahense]|uniref:Alpha-amylase family glycosyl hydrolase n=1 Tax=Oceanobacillus jeddahense TaxID=1462527 RepID=A0ABY5JZJ6_9BACI|nr:alpha-amylase family glycosyl hydrolase [Oceanobacillus jeddahense]UUI05200.1 alpha-amylase family glycosyl hydrolase [Oceanobacillus jeddahense]
MIKKLSIGLAAVMGMLIIQAPVHAQDEDIHNEVFYQILIDRFNNGDIEIEGELDINDPYNYHGGDFQGIINKLDDLQDIGITTISVTPIMENKEQGYHGFWIDDFYQVNPQFGTMEDFERLVSEVHDRDMKIVIDFVFNYAADTNPLTEDEDKEDWWLGTPDSDNEWLSETVQIDLTNPEAAEYMLDVASYWQAETEVDGFKLQDVDMAPQAFIEELTAVLKENRPDFYLIGDIAAENIDEAADLVENTSLDLINYPDLNQVLSETLADSDKNVSEVYDTWEEQGLTDFYKQIDGFHQERFTNIFSENQRNAVTAWTLALTYMYTTPGPTMITQGTEIPMYGMDAEESQRLVPFNSGDEDLKEFHKRIASLHNEFPALRFGDFEYVGSDASLSVFRRSYEDEVMYVAINNGSESAYIDEENLESGMQLTGILEDNLVRENEEGNYRIGIPRESVEVYILEEDKGFNWLFIGFIVSVLALFVIAVVLLKRKQKLSEQRNNNHIES